MPSRQHRGVAEGQCASVVHRMPPPAMLQTDVARQLVPPPTTLRQQTFPLVHDAPSRQPMLAPPPQGACGLTHICVLAWTQQAWTPGVQLVAPQGMGTGA